MTKFDEALSEGRLVISFCKKCQKFVWPPSSQCNVCYNMTSWEESSKIGKIVELSKKEDCYFGLIETNDKIRMLGSLESNITPNVGQSVELYKCSYDQKPKFIFKLI